MKKILRKKMKNSSNAVRYFSSETLTTSITHGDLSCYIVLNVTSCPC